MQIVDETNSKPLETRNIICCKKAKKHQTKQFLVKTIHCNFNVKVCPSCEDEFRDYGEEIQNCT